MVRNSSMNASKPTVDGAKQHLNASKRTIDGAKEHHECC